MKNLRKKIIALFGFILLICIEAGAEGTTKKLCSLTFDDGPNRAGCSTMNDMLDVLEKHGVVASFFLIGSKIDITNETVIKRAYSLGCDIENHSWSHKNMPKLEYTENQIQEEIQKTNKAIKKITGKQPEFLRAPNNSVNDLMYETIKMPFICGRGCKDWSQEVTVEECLEKLLSLAQDGIIFLLHVSDGNSKTTETVDRIIPILKSLGYEFVTVPELFKRKGVNPMQRKLWTVVK